MTSKSYGHTADYTYIDEALRARWEPFTALESEMAHFEPRPPEDFRAERDAEVQRLRVLNPGIKLDELVTLVDKQFALAASPGLQFYARFDKRHMTEYVSVVMLSHALTEALINAALAIGLANAGTADLFPLVERAGIKQKWLFGPKTYAPQYVFPIGSGIHETLTMLSRARNTLVHHKIEVTVEGKKVLDGSGFERKRVDQELIWLRRFFSLPYDLSAFIATVEGAPPTMLLFDRKPIDVAVAHVGV